MDNGTRINDPVKMANFFNNYFVNAGSQIDKTIPRTKNSCFFLLKILISQPLSVIVNQFFEVGIFLDKLKVGKVNPLHKKTPAIIHLITD